MSAQDPDAQGSPTTSNEEPHLTNAKSSAQQRQPVLSEKISLATCSNGRTLFFHDRDLEAEFLVYWLHQTRVAAGLVLIVIDIANFVVVFMSKSREGNEYAWMFPFQVTHDVLSLSAALYMCKLSLDYFRLLKEERMYSNNNNNHNNTNNGSHNNGADSADLVFTYSTSTSSTNNISATSPMRVFDIDEDIDEAIGDVNAVNAQHVVLQSRRNAALFEFLCIFRLTLLAMSFITIYPMIGSCTGQKDRTVAQKRALCSESINVEAMLFAQMTLHILVAVPRFLFLCPICLLAFFMFGLGRKMLSYGPDDVDSFLKRTAMMLIFLGIIAVLSYKHEEYQRTRFASKVNVLNAIAAAKKRTQTLARMIRSMVPEVVATRIEAASWSRRVTVQDSTECATVVAISLARFIPWTSGRTPSEILQFLRSITELLQSQGDKFGVTSLYTFGDAFVHVCGLFDKHKEDHAVRCCAFAVAIRKECDSICSRLHEQVPVRMRCAVHSGPLQGGTVGRRLSYCIVGQTKDVTETALFSAGPGQIVATEDTVQCYHDQAGFGVGSNLVTFTTVPLFHVEATSSVFAPGGLDPPPQEYHGLGVRITKSAPPDTTPPPQQQQQQEAKTSAPFVPHKGRDAPRSIPCFQFECLKDEPTRFISMLLFGSSTYLQRAQRPQSEAVPASYHPQSPLGSQVLHGLHDSIIINEQQQQRSSSVSAMAGLNLPISGIMGKGAEEQYRDVEQALQTYISKGERGVTHQHKLLQTFVPKESEEQYHKFIRNSLTFSLASRWCAPFFLLLTILIMVSEIQYCVDKDKQRLRLTLPILFLALILSSSIFVLRHNFFVLGILGYVTVINILAFFFLPRSFFLSNTMYFMILYSITTIRAPAGTLRWWTWIVCDICVLLLCLKSTEMYSAEGIRPAQVFTYSVAGLIFIYIRYLMEGAMRSYYVNVILLRKLYKHQSNMRRFQAKLLRMVLPLRIARALLSHDVWKEKNLGAIFGMRSRQSGSVGSGANAILETSGASFDASANTAVFASGSLKSTPPSSPRPRQPTLTSGTAAQQQLSAAVAAFGSLNSNDGFGSHHHSAAAAATSGSLIMLHPTQHNLANENVSRDNDSTTATTNSNSNSNSNSGSSNSSNSNSSSAALRVSNCTRDYPKNHHHHHHHHHQHQHQHHLQQQQHHSNDTADSDTRELNGSSQSILSMGSAGYSGQETMIRLSRSDNTNTHQASLSLQQEPQMPSFGNLSQTSKDSGGDDTKNKNKSSDKRRRERNEEKEVETLMEAWNIIASRDTASTVSYMERQVVLLLRVELDAATTPNIMNKLHDIQLGIESFTDEQYEFSESLIMLKTIGNTILFCANPEPSSSLSADLRKQRQQQQQQPPPGVGGIASAKEEQRQQPPTQTSTSSAIIMLHFARALVEHLEKELPFTPLTLVLNAGPCVGAVLGVTKFSFEMYGTMTSMAHYVLNASPPGSKVALADFKTQFEAEIPFVAAAAAAAGAAAAAADAQHQRQREEADNANAAAAAECSEFSSSSSSSSCSSCSSTSSTDDDGDNEEEDVQAGRRGGKDMEDQQQPSLENPLSTGTGIINILPEFDSSEADATTTTKKKKKEKRGGEDGEGVKRKHKREHSIKHKKRSKRQAVLREEERSQEEMAAFAFPLPQRGDHHFSATSASTSPLLGTNPNNPTTALKSFAVASSKGAATPPLQKRRSTVSFPPRDEDDQRNTEQGEQGEQGGQQQMQQQRQHHPLVLTTSALLPRSGSGGSSAAIANSGGSSGGNKAAASPTTAEDDGIALIGGLAMNQQQQQQQQQQQAAAGSSELLRDVIQQHAGKWKLRGCGMVDVHALRF